MAITNPITKCQIDNCLKPDFSHGWCSMHYARHKRHGSPYIVLKPRQSSRPRKAARCDYCGKAFMVKVTVLEKGNGRTCSRRCAALLRIKEHRTGNAILTRFQKGHDRSPRTTPLPKEIQCACGCGHIRLDKDRAGRTHRFIRGHHKGRLGKKYTPTQLANYIEQRRRQVLPVKDTKIEVALQRALTAKGIPFETHKPIKGQPDIFIAPSLCVFADGCYWHYCPEHSRNESQAHRPASDKRVAEILQSEGYRILRFWEHEIYKNLSGCVERILAHV